MGIHLVSDIPPSLGIIPISSVYLPFLYDKKHFILTQIPLFFYDKICFVLLFPKTDVLEIKIINKGIEPPEEGALLSSGGFGLKCLLKNLS